MNIVILHRIPYAKVRYDLAIDHARHRVTYLCLDATSAADLPSTADFRLLERERFDADHLAATLAPLWQDADRIIARSEYDLLAAAQLRERFDIPGERPAALLPLRDKWLMRERCRTAGLPQPDYWDAATFAHQAPETGRYLIKPRLEASSTGIVTGTRAEIAARLAQLDDTGALIVEAFVPGDIFHVDGFIAAGRIVTAVTSDYVGDCLNYANGAPLGSAQRPADAVALALAGRTLAALGQRDGSFHFEGIRDPDGHYWFLETAARVGGAGVAETFELKTGINLYQADLYYQLHAEAPVLQPREHDHYFGWFVYPGHRYHGPLHVDFDAARWQDTLRSHQRNHRPRDSHGISYTPGASPLSGVVQGNADAVRHTLQRIFAETRVSQTA
ncbi:ATP-grasp domain-containing protein [Chitiniphilus eburneus]|uniref:ATP-grasp domain-containing protein n=1 Tax=Chitiniphilus eburneus TaxID=2571148 RepID=A0A4V5MP11_9NEIS|nr:ATP-grasp domain-containing protein [Chitiniphilus eburneus]TJZ66838.1 ATP-grasp domain-containing protein [Chitiniphilus eburneus]